MGEKEKGSKYVLLNTFRPKRFYLSSEVNSNYYYVSSKLCYGKFVVYNSLDEYKPTYNAELLDDSLRLDDIKPVINSSNIYFPIYLRTKIGNSRKKGKDNVKKTIKTIVDEYDKYFNLYKEDELYCLLSSFFDLIYEEIVKMNKNNSEEYKIMFSKIDPVGPVFKDENEWNSEILTSYYYLSNDFLNNYYNNKVINNSLRKLIESVGLLYTINFKIEKIIEDQSIRNSIYNAIYTLGLPYIINSEFGDTIHSEYDMANCYDSFIIIGILIEMIKKINYPVDTDKYKEVLAITNLPNMKKDKLEEILKNAILSEYDFMSKITNISNSKVTIKFDSDTKKATEINNILDFYYHYFFNHYDDKSFLDSIKVEELEKFRKLLSEKRNKKYKQKIENYDYRQLRQLKQQQLNYNWFDAKK